MKICVLRRDGQKVHYGMLTTISTLTENYFEEMQMFIEKDEREFTEMITFALQEDEDLSKIFKFITKVSEINPLYAVRILR